MARHNPVPKLYQSVVDDVINGVRDVFLDEGLDEQVLQELKQIWETKLLQSKAVEVVPKSDTNPHVLSTQLAMQQHREREAARHEQQQAGDQFLITQQHRYQQRGGGPADVKPMMHLPQFDGAGEVDTMPAVDCVAGGSRTGGCSDHSSTSQTGSECVAGPSGVGTLSKTGRRSNDRHRPSNNSNGSHRGRKRVNVIPQYDGPAAPPDSSDDDDEDDDHEYRDKDDDLEDDDDDNNEDDGADGAAGGEDEPLNSDDDISDEEPQALFDTENVVVCQYDKVSRVRSKWKFHLKDGIMNLNGRDFVFQRALGEAEW